MVQLAERTTTEFEVQVEAADAYVQALRTGTVSSAARAARFLAADVVVIDGKQELRGIDQVRANLSTKFPRQPTYERGQWSYPTPQAGQLVVTGRFPDLGSTPEQVTLTFSFDAAGRIARVEHAATREPQQIVDQIPAHVRSVVNGALANGTPLVLAYVNAAGQPVQTIRGSVQVYGPRAVCAWLRHAEGETVNAIRANPNVSLMYRDSRTRTTISFEGIGRFTETDVERERVYELAPETEQMHVPDRIGIGLIVDVQRMLAFTPSGTYKLNRDAR
jgi:hypothetical protein